MEEEERVAWPMVVVASQVEKEVVMGRASQQVVVGKEA